MIGGGDTETLPVALFVVLLALVRIRARILWIQNFYGDVDCGLSILMQGSLYGG
jgi:hypothetical protein